MATARLQSQEVSGSSEPVHPLTIAVEGNIGSGKSTFIEYCNRQPGIVAFSEPVEQWQNVNGTNLLVGLSIIIP